MSGWPGNLLSGAAAAVNPTGPLDSASAVGVWDASEKAAYQSENKWPLGGLGIGETVFTTPGTYSWIAPAMATRVSVVCVGGGGFGGGRGPGSGGGALAYRNNITVTPGSSYEVIVGNYGNSTGSYAGISNPGFPSSAFGCIANGGGGTSQGYLGGDPGGTYDGGGSGGKGGDQGSTSNQPGKGGGGAGGYAGNGGSARGVAYLRTDAQVGSGAGAGGEGVAGGGVGLFGIGADGVGSGVPGSGGSGRTYGGGGRGNTNSDSDLFGGTGAVRIMWGPSRAFPSSYANTRSDIDMSTGLPV